VTAPTWPPAVPDPSQPWLTPTPSPSPTPSPVSLPAMPGVPATVVLADHEIRAAIADGELQVEPHEPELVRPAALSLRLGTKAYILDVAGPVDTAVAESYPRLRPRSPDEHGRLVIQPGEVVLAPTLERLVLPDTLVGVLDGISDVARLGMSVVLAQQVSPGFGQPEGAVLTLEIVSRLPTSVYLHPGMRICNLLLLRCAKPNRSYADMAHNHSGDRDVEPSFLSHHVRAGLPRHTGPTAAIDPRR
jgi:dCTP deaminase